MAISSTTAAGLGAFALVCLVWAYLPGLREVVSAWDSNPDYSHGYLVIPVSAFFLWARRSHLNMSLLGPSWWGLAMLTVVGVIRFAAGLYFLGPLDIWTFPLSLAGAVLLLYGWPCLKWALTSIVFLYFMIPIPYSAETMLSVPLQRMATFLSTETLVLLGQPAIAEGNVIWLEETSLMVAEACSGLRILVGIAALAFAYVLFSSWAWWQKLLLLAATLPVALVANSVRIVCTGLLYRYVSGEAAHRFSHDLAGFAMIPFAALLFWLFLAYLERLFPKVQPVSAMKAFGSIGRSA